jgi:hypothetical protein
VELDCSEIFRLGPNFGRGGSLSLDPVERPPFLALHLGEVKPVEPVRFRVPQKRMLGDIAGVGHVRPNVVSPKVIAVLTDGGFTGWSTFPIEVEGPMRDQFTGYAGLSITGRSGPIDDSLSVRVILPPPVPYGRASPALKGQCPQPGSWDGSDLFVPEDTSFTCVTTAVRDALVTARVVGIALERMSEMTMPILDE